MRIRQCAFCNEYKKQRDIGEMEKKHGYNMFIEACMYIRSVTKFGVQHYTIYSKRMRLRYCPSCGKKLED